MQAVSRAGGWHLIALTPDPSPKSGEASPKHALQSKILIADDNQPNVELLEAYLADVDCEIAVAADGRETLEKVAEFKPDLILLDIMMPKLSGFEVCRMLKQTPQTSQIMILMVTALGEPGDIERAVACGCDDFSASRSTSSSCSSGWRTCSNCGT